MTDFDMATLFKPMDRAQALRCGALVDCTLAAGWVGFRTQAAMTAGAWEETVGGRSSTASRAELRDAGERLRCVWLEAQAACSDYKRRGLIAPAITFKARAVAGGGLVPLVLTASVARGVPAVTLYLEGET